MSSYEGAWFLLITDHAALFCFFSLPSTAAYWISASSFHGNQRWFSNQTWKYTDAVPSITSYHSCTKHPVLSIMTCFKCDFSWFFFKFHFSMDWKTSNIIFIIYKNSNSTFIAVKVVLMVSQELWVIVYVF